jgi:hypothetical protein
MGKSCPPYSTAEVIASSPVTTAFDLGGVVIDIDFGRAVARLLGGVGCADAYFRMIVV